MKFSAAGRVTANPASIGRHAVRLRALSCVIVAAFGCPAAADDAPPVPSHHDLVIFDRERPFFLRLDLRVSGELQSERWIADLQRQIAEIDSDTDGAITRTELEDTRSSAEGPTGESSLSRTPGLWDADVSPFDGRVTATELSGLLHGTDSGPVQFVASGGPARDNSQLSDRLFGTLDRDADGKLSRSELTAASESFRRIDFDEDGAIAAGELESADPYYRSFAAAANRDPAPALPIFSLSAGNSPTELARRIFKRYGDAAGRIGPRAMGLEPAVFERYDADADEALDFDELRYFLRHPVPTLVLVIDLGRVDAGSSPITVWPPETEPAVPMRTAETGLISIVLALGQIELRCLQPVEDAEITSSLQAHFQGLDRDNNLYLEQKEVASDQLIGPVFSACDRNGDGQLFEDELLAALAQSLQSARSRAQVSATDRGRDLFAILDADGNRTIGRREFDALSRRIGLWDDDADGAIRPAEVPQVYQLSLGPGRPSIARRSLPITMGSAAASPNDEVAAPSWFPGMDRNADGGISAGEFLGPAREFTKFDRNSDGLIDAAEANWNP